MPCYGFNEGDWFIWNALSTSGTNNGPNNRGVFGPNQSRRIAEFTDGTSQTLFASDVKALNPFCQVGGQFSEADLSSPTAPLPSPYANPLSVAVGIHDGRRLQQPFPPAKDIRPGSTATRRKPA